MTAKELLTDLYTSREVDLCIAKLRGFPDDSIKEDLKQFVFLNLLEMPEEVITGLHRDGRLKHYVAKMIYNTANWRNRSKFYNAFGPAEMSTETFDDIADTPYDEINIPLHKIYWYKAELLRLYSVHGTYQAVADITRINVVSVFKTVRQARKEIKPLIE